MAKKTVLNEEEKEQEKLKSLNRALEGIRKEFGDGSIMKLGENKKMDISAISTGSINLDMALGIGGVPRGRIIEIYGTESSGKTTIALHIIAEAQKQGGVVAFIDAEHALDPIYAKALGVDVNELLISQPDFGEQALEIADILVRSSTVDVVVVDSVAALVPKAEIEGVMADQQMGLQARLMSKALRKLTANVSKSNTVLIFINQVREKIGGFGFSPGGAPQTTTSGGRALRFFSTIRIEIKKGFAIKNGDDIVGTDVTAKVTKNKVAPPHREAKFSILYGKGISHVGEILDIALEKEICKKSGSWFSFGDERLGQGKLNVENMLRENETLFNRIKEKVLISLGLIKEESLDLENKIEVDSETEK